MSPIVSTRAGDVRGTLSAGGIRIFRGIPYAAAPVGELRFAPPRPPAAWPSPLDATAYGPTAPQRESTGPLSELLPNVVIPGDDYLNLNVWTPDGAENLPVMVFVHGGSFTGGSGAVGGYDGSAFARDGVVLVTINYRLGADGFAWFGEGPANLGMLDQIAALEWVRDNAVAFGGDASRVTVFGESAGGMSVGALLAMPAARGLFQRAILESGAAHHAVSAGSAVLVANRLADILGVERSFEGIATVPTERLLEAQAQLGKEVSKRPSKKLWGDVAANGLPFEPVIDGLTLPAAPITTIAAGASAQVGILVGSNTEEAMLAFAPAGNLGKIRGWLLYFLAIRVGLPAVRTARVYRAARPKARAVDRISDLITDWLYRIPAVRLAEAHPGSFVYEFAWRSPAFDGEYGAGHGAELPFVFDNLGNADWAMMTGSSAPQSLADDVHGAWVRFATTGDPGWAAYSADDRVVRRFDTVSTVVTDPASSTRELWTGRR